MAQRLRVYTFQLKADTLEALRGEAVKLGISFQKYIGNILEDFKNSKKHLNNN